MEKFLYLKSLIGEKEEDIIIRTDVKEGWFFHHFKTADNEDGWKSIELAFTQDISGFVDRYIKKLERL